MVNPLGELGPVISPFRLGTLSGLGHKTTQLRHTLDPVCIRPAPVCSCFIHVLRLCETTSFPNRVYLNYTRGKDFIVREVAVGLSEPFSNAEKGSFG